MAIGNHCCYSGLSSLQSWIQYSSTSVDKMALSQQVNLIVHSLAIYLPEQTPCMKITKQ